MSTPEKVTLKPIERTPRRKSPFLKFLGGLAYLVVITTALVFGSLIGWLNKSEVTSVENIVELAKKTPPQEIFGNRTYPKHDLTLLILGCDREMIVNEWKAKVPSDKPGRSDMMMVARLDFDNQSIGAVSIPRDTRLRLTYEDNNGRRHNSAHKINAYHAIGGPKLATQAVEELLPGVRIDRVVVLDFDAFVEIVDMLGGVEMYVPKRMKYDDDWGDLHIDLEKGRQHLTGYEAMGFVRFRKNDSDFERQKRQKDLLVSLKKKMIENWTLAPMVAEKSLDLAGNAFNGKEMMSVLMFARSVSSDNIKMGQIPVSELPGTTDLNPITSQIEETLEEYRVVSKSYAFVKSE